MKKSILMSALIILLLSGNIWALEYAGGNIHGFISQGYLDSSDNNFLADTHSGTFQFREMGINYSREILSGLRGGFQLFSRDLGDIGNNEIEIDWAYLDYNYRKWLGVRLGKMKTPMGFYNETRDFDISRVNVFLPQGVYNEGWRDSFTAKTGVGIYGKIPMNQLGDLKYQAQVGEMDIEEDGGIAKFTDGQTHSTTLDFDVDTTYAAELQWETPLPGLRIGVSGNWFDYDHYFSTNDTTYWRNRTEQAFWIGAGITPEEWAFLAGMGFLPPVPTTYEEYQAYGVDMIGLRIEMPVENYYYILSAEFVWGDLTLAAEFAQDEIEYKMMAPLPYGTLIERKFKFEGYYYSAAYRFTEWFELGTYYSVFYPDCTDKEGYETQRIYDVPREINWSKDTCLSARFDINQNWILKIEGHSIDGLAVMYIIDQDKNKDESLDVDKDWNLFAFKLTYTF